MLPLLLPTKQHAWFGLSACGKNWLCVCNGNKIHQYSWAYLPLPLQKLLSIITPFKVLLDEELDGDDEDAFTFFAALVCGGLKLEVTPPLLLISMLKARELKCFNNFKDKCVIGNCKYIMK